MPASLPGETKANNTGANPAVGQPVAFDLISGPKGSPMDKDTAGNASTGALSTGIGYGLETGPISPFSNPLISNALFGIIRAGFTDDYIPGATKLDGTAAVDSRFMYIGTGRTQTSGAPLYRNVPGAAGTNPYTAGFGIGAAGNGGSRDAGAGPAFTGFPMKMVTAPGAVAIGAVVEAGFTNRSGVALTNGQSVLGSQVAASAAVA